MAQLKEAIDQLSHVELSVPDSDFDGLGTNLNQSILSGGTGYQSVNSGQDQKINSGGGKMFVAHSISFGAE